MSADLLQPGEPVVHPLFGLGVIEGVMTRSQKGQATDYYTIRLSGDGLLSLPIAQAEAIGLRRAVNGLAAIVACLHSPACPLPDDTRERVVELSARWRASQPQVLIETVRDLVNRSHTRNLTPADKKWLAGAHERLSAEAALVDGIDREEARAAIQREIEQLKQRAGSPGPHLR
jgi:RNA polymerase-interacting CarD/CdnL/TRCF family regulator